MRRVALSVVAALAYVALGYGVFLLGVAVVASLVAALPGVLIVLAAGVVLGLVALAQTGQTLRGKIDELKAKAEENAARYRANPHPDEDDDLDDDDA